MRRHKAAIHLQGIAELDDRLLILTRLEIFLPIVQIPELSLVGIPGAGLKTGLLPRPKEPDDQISRKNEIYP